MFRVFHLLCLNLPRTILIRICESTLLLWTNTCGSDLSWPLLWQVGDGREFFSATHIKKKKKTASRTLQGRFWLPSQFKKNQGSSFEKFLLSSLQQSTAGWSKLLNKSEYWQMRGAKNVQTTAHKRLFLISVSFIIVLPAWEKFCRVSKQVWTPWCPVARTRNSPERPTIN